MRVNAEDCFGKVEKFIQPACAQVSRRAAADSADLFTRRVIEERGELIRPPPPCLGIFVIKADAVNDAFRGLKAGCLVSIPQRLVGE